MTNSNYKFETIQIHGDTRQIKKRMQERFQFTKQLLIRLTIPKMQLKSLHYPKQEISIHESQILQLRC